MTSERTGNRSINNCDDFLTRLALLTKGSTSNQDIAEQFYNAVYCSTPPIMLAIVRMHFPLTATNMSTDHIEAFVESRKEDLIQNVRRWLDEFDEGKLLHICPSERLVDRD